MNKPVTIGNATLYCGDCFDILPNIVKVDVIITDPPYAIPTQAAQSRKGSFTTVGDLSMVEASFRSFFDLTLALIGETGRHFIFADGTSYPCIFRAIYGKSKTAHLVWDKGRIGMGREFRKRHEIIMHAWNSETEIVSSNGTGFSDILEYKAVNSSEREHIAQKPVELIEALLRVCGNTICDPFMGSGSTGMACMQQEKQFIGIEIEPKYFDIACKRIEKAQEQLRMFA